MILEDNPEDYSKPLILQFTNNEIFDLRDPHIYDIIQIQDIMKTMDNRIAIDENTLKHFTSDKYIKSCSRPVPQAPESGCRNSRCRAGTKEKGCKKEAGVGFDNTKRPMYVQSKILNIHGFLLTTYPITR